MNCKTFFTLKISLLVFSWNLLVLPVFAAEPPSENALASDEIIYFLPGALYNKGHKTLPFMGSFTADFIAKAKALYGENFVVIDGGVPQLPLLPLRVLWSSHWAVVHGNSELDYSEFQNINRVVNEISAHYQRFGRGKRIQIIGCSYGSVLAAHASIALLNKGSEVPQIDNLILSSSMICQDSELGNAIDELYRERAILKLAYVNDSTDNTVGVSGYSKSDANKGLIKLVFGDKDSPSIFWFNKHPHVQESNDKNKTKQLLELLQQGTAQRFIADKN